MNKEFVKSLINPYVIKSHYMTYSDFDKVFEFLGNHEKYEVIDLLIEWNIDLVDFQSAIKNDVTIELKDHCKKTKLEKDQDVDSKSIELTDWKKRIHLTNKQLCQMIQSGDSSAKAMLIIKNNRLVHKEANRYEKSYKHKLDHNDLVQAGYIGMLRAAEMFDISMENTFSTYAVFWIRQVILRTIYDEGFTIRIPVHMVEKINKISKIERNNQDCSQEDLIKCIQLETGLDETEVLQMISYRERIMSPVYLNQFISDDYDDELIDMIPHKSQPLDEEVVNQIHLEEIVSIAKGVLSSREYLIIDRRFGLTDQRVRTLEEVGNEIGVTRERIRQIEAKALRRLKNCFKQKGEW